ncbi:4Fe-4S dicluster domain-containing protein [Heliobacterium chlorum]|uniref:Ferredoxin-like protein n=1 Tax=Heliobacterium chlorum TaxID=2698 RepID=A0ABR7T7Q4_HELCL|nr:4Fe-4S dicluster domain-containing protein [Heliobacterium chlorum]MBC9785601.1 4Fe-4S dicluster domain-containing protein [Heliobacterium chlorum]
MHTLEDKLFLVRFQPDDHSHIHINNKELCQHDCPDKPCTYICPAKVYEWNEEVKAINVGYEGCLECGTCRYGCPRDNIHWVNPRGGFGVMYKFG